MSESRKLLKSYYRTKGYEVKPRRSWPGIITLTAIIGVTLSAVYLLAC